MKSRAPVGALLMHQGMSGYQASLRAHQVPKVRKWQERSQPTHQEGCKIKTVESDACFSTLMPRQRLGSLYLWPAFVAGSNRAVHPSWMTGINSSQVPLHSNKEHHTKDGLRNPEVIPSVWGYKVMNWWSQPSRPQWPVWPPFLCIIEIGESSFWSSIPTLPPTVTAGLGERMR